MNSTGPVLPVSYVLPILSFETPDEEFTTYLRFIGTTCELIIVDGSDLDIFNAGHKAWNKFAIHISPDPHLKFINAKVNGVLTGVRQASHEKVVIADDDVRYSTQALREASSLLDSYHLVRPQNYFLDFPWWAHWDTARSLINRAFGADFPGTFMVKRSSLVASAGYDGNVLFENLELIRTVQANGGAVASPLDLFVARRPPTIRHFIRQRVRQAYEELARPPSFAASLALVPILVIARRRRRLSVTALVMGTSSVMVAELGRRRGNGTTVFPARSALFAPLWVLERSITSWLSLLALARGGCRYSQGRLITAAHSKRQRRARQRKRVDDRLWP